MFFSHSYQLPPIKWQNLSKTVIKLIISASIRPVAWWQTKQCQVIVMKFIGEERNAHWPRTRPAYLGTGYACIIRGSLYVTFAYISWHLKKCQLNVSFRWQFFGGNVDPFFCLWIVSDWFGWNVSDKSSISSL